MSLKCGLVRYAALRSLRLPGRWVPLRIRVLICFTSLVNSPCLGTKVCFTFVGSTNSFKGGCSTKSSSSGVIISGSVTSSVSPMSIPVIGFCAFSNFRRVYFVMSISTSSPFGKGGSEWG